MKHFAALAVAAVRRKLSGGFVGSNGVDRHTQTLGGHLPREQQSFVLHVITPLKSNCCSENKGGVAYFLAESKMETGYQYRRDKEVLATDAKISRPRIKMETLQLVLGRFKFVHYRQH